MDKELEKLKIKEELFRTLTILLLTLGAGLGTILIFVVSVVSFGLWLSIRKN